jgi:hypothetical protein
MIDYFFPTTPKGQASAFCKKKWRCAFARYIKETKKRSWKKRETTKKTRLQLHS